MTVSELTLALSENQLQKRIIDRADARGWSVHHARPARTSQGWRTPISGSPGFCDLVLARAGRVIIAELKSEGGKLRPEQAHWLGALSGTDPEIWVAGDITSMETATGLVAVWRPSDLPTIEAILDARSVIGNSDYQRSGQRPQ